MAESGSSEEKNSEEEEHGETSSSLRGSVSPITAASKTSEKKLGFFTGRGYLKTLSQQKRRRIEQEIREGRKPGEIGSLKIMIIKFNIHV